MNILIAFIVGLTASIGGYLGYQEIQPQPDTLGAFGDPFLSLQLAPSPQNGYILSTDGTDNSWIANTGGSGGGGGFLDWNFPYLTPNVASTSLFAAIKADHFIATSTASTSSFAGPTLFSATSTFEDDIIMQHGKYLIAHGIKGDASDGFQIQANNGSIVANFGAGGGQNMTFSGYTSALLQTGSGGAVSEYAGTTCTNQFVRALSALGIATCATVDISSDTNLAGDTEIVLTGDTLSIASTIARDSELYTNADVSSYLYGSTTRSDLYTAGTGLSWTGTTLNAEVQTSDLHSAVTLAGEDFLSLSTQQITANAINADNLSASDFGDFTCNGTTCTLDASSISESMFNINTATAGYVLQASSTASGGFAWVATSTLGISAGTGDLWSDPVDADIIPATGSTYEIGSTTSTFANGFFDEINIGGDFFGQNFNSIDAQSYVGFSGGNITMNSGTGDVVIPSINLGIGTTSPEAKLDVWGASSGKILTLFSNTGTKVMEVINDTATVTIDGILAILDTLTIPFGTTCDSNADGEICHDTTDDQLVLDSKVIRTSDEIFKVKYASSSLAMVSGVGTDLPVLFDAYTVTDIACHVEGGTSKVITLFGESITCLTSVTQDDGTITSGATASLATTTITAGADSGSWDWLNLTVYGTYTRE